MGTVPGRELGLGQGDSDAMIPVVLTFFADKIATAASVEAARAWLVGMGVPMLSPYIALWAGVMLVYVPAGVNLFIRAASGDTNNTTPRTGVAKLCAENPLFNRLQCCHQHLLETYPMFVAAVLAAVQAGVPDATVSTFATLWCAARTVYIAAYAAGTIEAIGAIRTISFAVCVVIQGALLLLAAKQ